MDDQMRILFDRVDKLEQDVRALKSQAAIQSPKSWWERIAGRFENDSVYDEIVLLGREYRESQRPQED